MKTPQQYLDEERYGMAGNVNSGTGFLTQEKVREIRRVKRAMPGESLRSLGTIFGCSDNTIRKALSDQYDDTGAKVQVGTAGKVEEGNAVVLAIQAMADETTLEHLYAEIQANNHLLYEIAEMLRRYLELPGYKASEGRGQSLAQTVKEEYIK